MTIASDATSEEDDDCQFEYVAPSANREKGAAGAGAQRVRKTVYEEERDARVSAIVSQQGLKLPLQSEAAPATLRATEKEGKVTERQDAEEEGKKSTKSAPNPTEEAQRLKNQRYSIYRRNRYLNQNALREVDPGTKRHMQIVYTPSNAGGKQYHTLRRGGYTGTFSGGRRFTPRFPSGFKRKRE
ncbi:hypothetical protein TcCL_ESM04285 [Trypanosoma cruzi]|uniref:Uncharacterized protein n=1 Tax=Trypanosoma cruzi (strain CL Brener) TaxID=353153 RepID=Q4DV38_TRYCC|nr:hypothetical protein, conserved [Trypanosoma cruzi]EAN96411.1 hypothetical protein, conserved [Trypanosoma cruzi]RNC58085.1 hypothetical protein TcCL_ESM04285 [Trypanosoma cruzi]|eukprot:XP_818262.1 hypothetical protein [Trypanosoma cruzi strain CL Brener]